MNLTAVEKKVARLVARQAEAKARLNRARLALGDAGRQARTAREAQQLAQQVAELVQTRAHARLSALVTRCLVAVFGEGHGFRIDFDRKRGKTEAKLILTEGGLELSAEECSGGVLDVAAFALRLACLLLQRPVRRRLLVLDEPFRYVSKRKEYRERVRELLLTLSEELEVQIVQVTHSRELEIGKVVEL